MSPATSILRQSHFGDFKKRGFAGVDLFAEFWQQMLNGINWDRQTTVFSWKHRDVNGLATQIHNRCPAVIGRQAGWRVQHELQRSI